MARTAAARATEARDTPIISPAWLNVTSPLRADRRLASKAPLRRVQVVPVHVHRRHPRRHVGPALQLADLRTTPAAAHARTRFRPSPSWLPLTTNRLAQAVYAHVLDQLVELAAGHDREHRRRMDRYCLPPISTSSTCASCSESITPNPRDGLTRNGPRGRTYQRAPAIALPVAACGHRRGGRRSRGVGLHAQSSHPPPKRVELQTRSERRQPPAGRTPPPAGPGTAVRPPSRGREEQRPRDGRRTPALATAHPAGLNSGPARRVRLSQIPASRTARAKSERRR